MVPKHALWEAVRGPGGSLGRDWPGSEPELDWLGLAAADRAGSVVVFEGRGGEVGRWPTGAGDEARLTRSGRKDDRPKESAWLTAALCAAPSS